LAESFPDPKNFAEMVAKMAEDRFFTELVRRSGLTKKQVETLLLDVMSQRDGITMTSQQKAALRGVTKGAYTRTKQQALRNVQKALYTLLLLTYLGLLTLPSYQSISTSGSGRPRLFLKITSPKALKPLSANNSANITF
jgi:hypothetical protein